MITALLWTSVTLAVRTPVEPAISLQETGKRHALLIGVQYPEKSLQLNTKPDVEAIKNLLVTRFKYKDPGDKSETEEFIILDTPEATSKTGIEAGFNKLIGRVRENSGDVVLIHYSGHGSQVPDDDGDETSDRMDETICPSDVQKKDGTGNSHLRDDQIGLWLEQLSKKNPKSIVVIFDSCHSGTGTRSGNALSRRLPEEWSPRPQIENLLFTSRGGGDSMGDQEPESGGGILKPSQRSNKNLVVLAAARAEQTAYETNRGQDMGAFTGSLLQAFSHVAFQGLKEIPVRQLFDTATTLLHQQHNRLQDPQLEGARDTYFLTDDTVPKVPFYRIEKKSEGVTIDAGWLGMVTQGSLLQVFPSSVVDPQNQSAAPAAIVRVQQVREYHSVIVPTEDSPVQGRDWTQLVEKGGIHAFMTMRAIGDTGIKVVVDKRLRAHPDFAKIEAALKEVGIADAVGNFDPGLRSATGASSPRPAPPYDVLISPAQNQANAIELRRRDDALISPRGLTGSTRGSPSSTISLNEDDFKEALKLALERESRVHFLSNLRNDSLSVMKLKMRVRKVLTKPDPEDPQYRLFDKYADMVDPSGVFDSTMRPGDYFSIEVCNYGKLPAVVHILDITSDGAVSQLWPFDDVPGSADPIPPPNPLDDQEAWVPLSYPVGPGQKLPMIYRVGEEEGPEVLKLIAAKEKLRLDGMLTRDATKGSDDPLEEMLRLATMGTRQSEPAVRRKDYRWWTDQVSFTVRRGK
jgi:hypothetical protein